jgi:voltage-gated potassium channel
MNSRPIRRFLRALWRDTRALVRQSRVSLLIFCSLLTVGTLALRLFYIDPQTGEGLGWAEAFHATLMLTLAEVSLSFPNKLGLQLLLFVVPLVGLSTVVDGVIRFGVALVNRRNRKEAWTVAIASTYRNHVVVCGMGKVGYRVTKELLQLGEDVIGIEQNPELPFLEEVRQLNVPILLGDARRQDLLDKARVADASAIVVCTEHDLTNLDIALEARELNPSIKVVMRMFDGSLAGRVRRGFGIHTAFSTSTLAAPVFAAAATRAKIEQSFYLDGVLMNVAHATVQEGSRLVGYTVARAEDDLDLTIVLHKGQEATDPHPGPDIVLGPGDCLTVFASLQSLAHLREMCGEVCPSDSGAARPSRGRPKMIRLFSRKKTERDREAAGS